MKSASRFLMSLGGAVAATACAAGGGAHPQLPDLRAEVGDPRYEPMLMVPMPPLRQDASGQRPVEALQARNTPVGDVLLALFKDSDINLLVDAAVQAKECTFDIKRSTVEETFAAVLRSLDLGYEWDGNYLHIVDRVRQTVHVDLMDQESSTSDGSSGSGGSGGSSSTGSSSGGGSTSFWETVENGLQELLGEGATYVINRAASTIHVEARPSGVARLRELVDTTVRRANRQVSLEARLPPPTLSHCD